MSLLELKLTILEDCIKRNENRWQSEYIREHWKFEPFLETLKTKDLLPLSHRVGTPYSGFGYRQVDRGLRGQNG